jgi:hypothetical protein
LKRFEEAWEKQPDPAARKRAAAILPDITPMFFSLFFEVKVNNLGTGGVGMNIFAFTTDDETSASNVLTLSTCGFGPPELCLFYNDEYLDGTARPRLHNEFNFTWTPVTIVYTDGFLSMQTTGAAEIYDISLR